MNSRNSLVVLLVIAALLGYVLCTAYIFYQNFDLIENGKLLDNAEVDLNTAIVYLSIGLTGLVGSIVATAFGVKTPDGFHTEHASSPSLTKKSYKLANLGSFATNKDSEKTKILLGKFYAFTYVIIGLISIAIWVILSPEVFVTVKTMATTFFGMMIPIVAKYFSTND